MKGSPTKFKKNKQIVHIYQRINLAEENHPLITCIERSLNRLDTPKSSRTSRLLPVTNWFDGIMKETLNKSAETRGSSDRVLKNYGSF